LKISLKIYIIETLAIFCRTSLIENLFIIGFVVTQLGLLLKELKQIEEEEICTFKFRFFELKKITSKQ